MDAIAVTAATFSNSRRVIFTNTIVLQLTRDLVTDGAGLGNESGMHTGDVVDAGSVDSGRGDIVDCRPRYGERTD